MNNSVEGASTRLDELERMRVVLARALDNPDTAAHALPALARRVMEIRDEIERLEREKQRDIEAMGSGDDDDEKWDPAAI